MDESAVNEILDELHSRTRRGSHPSTVKVADLDSVYVVVNGGSADESLLARSDATLFVLRELGGIGRGYRLIARHRYRIFGRYETCPVPGESVRERFLGV